MVLGTLTTIIIIIGLIILNFFIQPIGILIIGIVAGIVAYQEMQDEEPEEILRSFGIALMEGNEEEARRLGSNEMDNTVDMILQTFASFQENGLESFLEEVRSIDCEENNTGESAVCTMCIGTADCQDIRLIQEDGQWVVDITKE